LDEMVGREYESAKPMGSIKITTQKFYRINGDATQLKGVIPDILLPDNYSYIKIGEEEMDKPMPWDEIPPVKYTSWTKTVNLDKLRLESKSRIKQDNNFTLVDEGAKILKQRSEETSYSLNIDKFRGEQKRLKENAKKYEAAEKEISDFEMVSTKADLQGIQSDSVKTARTKEWFKFTKKDIYISEAIAIAKDMK